MGPAGGFRQGRDGTHATDAQRQRGDLAPLNPSTSSNNIAAGTRYVTALMWEFHGELRLVAAADATLATTGSRGSN